ncbi:MAG TPA: HAMP domain-containing sensor histidine kinase, partial [Chloroflexota bacterium]|nr:HAMP domain-containing sensor histidine kinase [Chloroflexota bacterium]
AREGHLDEGEREAMELFAAHAAAALERARFLHEQAGRVAAESAVRARDELMAVASHDVKNPLTVIKGTADNLLRQLKDGRVPPTDRLTERIERIASAATRATALLDDMRATAAAAVAAADDSPTDLVALARAAVESQRDASGTHRVGLESDEESLVGAWDAGSVGRVLDNLLSNAVKYSPSQSTVTVRVRREGESAVLEVEDHGVGIPAAELPRIFDRFYRGSNVAARVSGSGIGLSAVRTAVEQLGGAISARSTEGAGSTFTVKLPLPSPS